MSQLIHTIESLGQFISVFSINLLFDYFHDCTSLNLLLYSIDTAVVFVIHVTGRGFGHVAPALISYWYKLNVILSTC